MISAQTLVKLEDRMARLAGNVGLAEIVHHQFIRAAETPRKRLRIRADETHVWVGRLSGVSTMRRMPVPLQVLLEGTCGYGEAEREQRRER